MKKTILTLLPVVMLAQKSVAQISDKTFLYSRYTLGISAGGTMLKGDVPVTKINVAAKLNFDYNLSPFLSIGMEGQFGMLEEGNKPGSAGSATNELYSKSTYGALNINGRLAAGQFITTPKSTVMNLVKNVYIGTGLGYVRTHVTDVNRGSANLEGNNNSNVIAVPTNLGIDIPLKKKDTEMPTILLNINYQFNFILNDDLDAFNYQSAFNNAKDAYSLFSLGLKFSLGKTKFRTKHQ